MENFATLDAWWRGVFPLLFETGDVFVNENQSGEVISFRLLKPAEVPVVKLRRQSGLTMLDVTGPSRAHRGCRSGGTGRPMIPCRDFAQ